MTDFDAQGPEGPASERATPSGTPRPGDILAGRFRIQNRVATGGFGQLYVAEQLAMGRLVALKRIHADLVEDPTAIERFRLEARAACQITHPNLVVYHDFGEDEGGTPFLVMEYIRGRTLSELLRATPVLPLSRAVHIVGQMCAALLAAHEAGIVHRDLKPGNVMLLRQGEDPDFVKIIDFGILKRTGEALEGRAGITRTDEIVGTPEYMAPEIIRGEPIDGRADQYAVGVMLYEMLAGRRPFQGPDVIATLLAQAREEAPPLAETSGGRLVSAPIEAVIRRAMDKDPAARYATMGTFAAALRAAAAPYLAEEHAAPTRRGARPETGEDEGPETRRLPAPAPPRRASRAWLLLPLFALAAILALLWPVAPKTGSTAAPDLSRAPQPGARASARPDVAPPVDAGHDVRDSSGGENPDARRAEARAPGDTGSSPDAETEAKAPAPRRAPPKGKLHISLNGAMGLITVDGKEQGKRKFLLLEVRPGRRRVHVAVGQWNEEQWVQVRSGETTKVFFTPGTGN